MTKQTHIAASVAQLAELDALIKPGLTDDASDAIVQAESDVADRLVTQFATGPLDTALRLAAAVRMLQGTGHDCQSTTQIIALIGAAIADLLMADAGQAEASDTAARAMIDDLIAGNKPSDANGDDPS